MQAKWCLAQSGSQPLLESKLWLTPSGSWHNGLCVDAGGVSQRSAVTGRLCALMD